MKLNVKKLQQGGNIKPFWGIQNGQYTPEYTNAVNSIINNPVLYKKITSNLNVKTPEDFKQLAFDNKIVPVHKSILNIQNSTTSLPKDIVRYKSQIGKTEIPSEQFINVHKQEFDQQLSNFNNDSISAYNTLTKTLPNIEKIGKYNNLTSVENKTINPKTSYLFKAKLQKGGIIYKPTKTPNVKLNIDKELEVNNLTPLDPIKQLSSTNQFSKSKFNFLNLPKQKPLLNFISMGNIGYNSDVVLKLIDDFEGFKDKVYKDGKGIDTIGHGLTDKKYISKGTITKEESLSGVKSHIDKEVIPHLKNKPYWNKLNDNQKSALISYVFNIGSGNFNTKSPSLQKALNEGNWEEAAKQIDFGYNDKKNPGLKKRRDKERQLFLS